MAEELRPYLLRGLSRGDKLWVKHEDKWAPATLSIIGTTFLTVYVPIPQGLRVLQVRPEEAWRRDSALKGADRPQPFRP
jgi:hypothetical protein